MSTEGLGMKRLTLSAGVERNLRTDALTTSGPVVAIVMQRAALERAPLAGAPLLSSASEELLGELEILDEHGDCRTIQVPVERRLTVLVDDRELATLWTIGGRPEWLVLGYLWNQQVISHVSALESIAVDWKSGTAVVVSRRDARAIDPSATGIHGGHELGGLCRGSSPLEALSMRVCASRRIARTTLLSVIENVPKASSVYCTAGSVHGCALFCGGELWLSVEDVSRRNTIDTVSGWMALHGISGDDKILFTTGRLTAEIIMKAACSGIPVIVSRKGVTGMCHELASRLGMTLFGHIARNRYICYAGAERFDTLS